MNPAAFTAEDRAALDDSLRRLLARRCTEGDTRRMMETPEGFDRELYGDLAELGILGLVIPAEHGGAGAGPIELEAVMEAAGAALLPGPMLASSVLAARLLIALGDDAASARWLPPIAAGRAIATVALTRTGGRWTAEDVAVFADPAGRLTGEAAYVLHARNADVLFVLARDADALALFEVAPGATGLSIAGHETFDRTLRLATVRFAATPARRLAGERPVWPAVEEALAWTLVALAGEQAGAARQVLDMTVEYAKTRRQFGRPIGAFQAIKHMAADLLLEVGVGDLGGAPGGARAGRGWARRPGHPPRRLRLRRGLRPGRRHRDPDARRDRLHLGPSGPPLPAPRSRRRPAVRRPGPSSRGLAGASGGGGMSEREDFASLCQEVEVWLSEHWRPDMDRRAFIAEVVEAGWAAPRWPAEWHGRDLSDAAARVVEGAFRAAGAPGAGQDRTNLWANTALAFAAEPFKREIVPALLRGEVAMCLLYSEPAAGSDLAAVRTRAERRGDEYIVNGQKLWTSSAAEADFGMLLARTDWDAPKHAGLSFFFLPMKQAGVEVRPLRQITDELHFNEVFFTDAIVPVANRLGAEGEGWRVLQTALAYERSVMGELARGPRSGGSRGESLVDLARAAGRLDDPLIRRDLARVLAWRELNRLNTARAKAELAQGTASPVMSLGKLAMSRILHAEAALRTRLLGPESLFAGRDHPLADDANFLALNAYFTSIGGGTDQIQRNIIAERVLGLPRDPDPDRARPFRDAAA